MKVVTSVRLNNFSKNAIKEAIDAYFAELTDAWSDTDAITVRGSQIESRILTDCAAFVVDISETSLTVGAESAARNITLDADSIPVRGTINGESETD